MKLDIIYEDKDIIVCYKPAGIATQTASLSSPDMVNIIKNHLAKTQKEKSPYVGVVHRLDQPVSGLLVFAKNKKAAANLSKQIQDGNANKDYLAMCYKVPKEKEGTLIHYMIKNPVTKLAEICEEDNLKASYKKAILDYKVERDLEDASILKIHLQTGRFHQIRVQMAHAGMPLLGDVKYGSERECQAGRDLGIRSVALCAYKLVFQHPVTGKKMSFEVKPENKAFDFFLENNFGCDCLY